MYIAIFILLGVVSKSECLPSHLKVILHNEKTLIPLFTFADKFMEILIKWLHLYSKHFAKKKNGISFALYWIPFVHSSEIVRSRIVVQGSNLLLGYTSQ